MTASDRPSWPDDPGALLAAIVASSDDAIVSKTLTGEIRSWNAGAERLFGWSAAEAIGRSIELIVPPERRREAEEILARVARGERVEPFDTVRVARDGRRLDISVAISPIRSADGRILGASKFARDIGPQKAAERALRASESRHRFLAALSAATEPLIDPVDVMAVAARLLAEHLDVDRCAYAEVEDGAVFVITGDHTRDVPSVVGRWPVAAFGPEVVRCMRDNEACVIADVDADPRAGDDLTAYRAARVRAVICAPLHKDGRLTAAMAVHKTTPRVWTDDEVALVRTVAARCWEALERARVARTLRASEARYRAIVDATPDCVKLLDRDGVLLQINPAGLRLIEADAAPPGTSALDLIAPEHREAFREFNARVCAGERASLDYDMIGLRGARRRMESTGVPLATDDGSGFLHLGLGRDITARAAAERALADSRARLDYAVRVSGLGFWYCDLPFDELMWDARVKEHFWLAPDARVTIETFYGRLHPDDREPTRRAIEASIADAAPYDVDYRTVDPVSGAVKWIRALGGTQYAADGTPVRFDGATVDNTARKQGEQQLAAVNATLQDQHRRKDEFLALLAHELRNPLAPIRYGLQVLRLADDPAARLRVQAMMDRQLEHMVRLIEDLLDVSRINRNRVDLRRESILLADVIGSAVEAARPLIDAAGLTLTIDLPHEPVVLDADLTRLAQVFSNLLTNSAKYTAPGGHIALSAARDDDHVTISVHDDGIGIPRAALPTIFDMFSQVDRSIERTTGGLGIGLAIVKGLIELHGGTVSADSGGPDRGSTFTVHLPALARTRPPVEAPEGPPPPARTRRVLVVDDNLDVAATMSMMLEVLGNEVHTVHDGVAAVAEAEAFQPEIVLMDIGMPRMNGYDATRRIREHTWGRGMTIVALTGWGQEDDRARSRAAGCDAHLVKPLALQDLEHLLASPPRHA